MKLLLDTQVVTWLGSSPGRLSPRALEAVSQSSEPPFMSLASVWEMSIKIGLGKLQLSDPIERYVEERVVPAGIALLPIHLSHLYRVATLPHFHGAPSDRLILAQARTEGLTLVSADRQFDAYDIKRLW